MKSVRVDGMREVLNSYPTVQGYCMPVATDEMRNILDIVEAAWNLIERIDKDGGEDGEMDALRKALKEG